MIKPLKSLTLKNDNGEDTTYVVTSAPAIVETTEPASVASFSDGAEGIPVSSLIADINPVQTGSGDPSPSNVRPITGWTGMNVVVSPTLDAQDGTTYPISWEDEAGTVYGGTLDVTTGLLTVTHQIVDLGDLTWSYNSSSLYFNADLPVAIPKVSTNVIADILCTAYAPTKFADMYNNASGGDIMVSANNGTAGNKKVYVTDKAYTDPAAFKSAVAGVKLVYAVLTPTTYQLTPQAVMTILGQNNIWADTGDVEVAYCADTKMYIDKMISEL